MEKIDPSFDRIESFLRKEMTQREIEDFEIEIKNNPQLAQKVADRKIEFDFMELSFEKDLYEKMSHWRKEEKLIKVGLSKNKIRTFNIKRNRLFYISAASVLLLICSSLFFFQIKPKYSNQSIAIAYYSLPNDFSSNLKSPSDEIEGVLIKGIGAVEKKEFEIAVKEFSSIPRENIYYSKARYLLAHTYYLNQDFVNASYSFKILADNEINKEEAEWFLLLSYLNSNKTNTDFYELLSSITSDPQHSYFGKAKHLEIRLDDFWYKFSN